MSKNYSDKLKDPRWQKKRLEVMGRDGFTCQNCGSKEKTLNVHHVVYTKGREPWEYDQSLLTLCEECHIERHNAQTQLLLSTCKCSVEQLQSLASFVAMFFNLKTELE